YVKGIHQQRVPTELHSVMPAVETYFGCHSRLASAKFMLHPLTGRRYPLQVDADKGAINAVFTELIDQAQKFGQKIDRLITLTTDRISQYDRKIQPYL